PCGGGSTPRLWGYIGGSPRRFFDDEWLAEPLRQPLRHHARDGVGIAARGKANNHAHRPRRIGLRTSEARHCRQRDGLDYLTMKQRDDLFGRSSWNDDGEPPLALYARIACFRHGGHVRQRLRSFLAC